MDVSICNGLVVNVMLFCDLMDYLNFYFMKWFGFVGLIVIVDVSKNLKNVFNFLIYCYGFFKLFNIEVDLYIVVLFYVV